MTRSNDAAVPTRPGRLAARACLLVSVLVGCGSENAPQEPASIGSSNNTSPDTSSAPATQPVPASETAEPAPTPVVPALGAAVVVTVDSGLEPKPEPELEPEPEVNPEPGAEAKPDAEPEPEPTPESVNRPPTLDGVPLGRVESDGAYAFTPIARDADGDTLLFTAVGLPDWLSLDGATGTLAGEPGWRNVGRHEGLQLEVSDGTSTARLPRFAIDVVPGEVERALLSGDAGSIAAHATLERATLVAIEEASTLHRPALRQLFRSHRDGGLLDSLTWNPTHDAARIASTPGENVALLHTNAVFQQGLPVQREALGVLGSRVSANPAVDDARYLALGGHPMRNGHRNANHVDARMNEVLANAIAWLTARDDLFDPEARSSLNVIIAQQGQSHYFPDEVATRAWLDDRFAGRVDYNAANACDGAALAHCVSTRPDLLIVSQHVERDGDTATAAAAVAIALAQGTPVLYLHHDGNLTPLGRSIFEQLDVRYVGDNYWHRLGLDGADPTGSLNEVPPELAELRTMVEHFHDGDFSIDWDACDGEDCSRVASLNEQFMNAARAVRARFSALDAARTDRFATPRHRYRLDKLLALLGDRYRLGASFPMDKRATPDLSFLRALYADMASYQSRDTVGAWSDLGNFARSDYDHITPVTRRVELGSKRPFRSTGAYALPGRTVTLTREDDSEVAVGVFVNTVRDGATHLFADDGYKRPRHLRGTTLPLAPGETIRFTSATGGPIQLSFDTNDLPVTVRFDNVGEHAHWRSPADDARFESALAAGELSWAELASPGFEVHSTLDRMRTSVQDPALGERRGSAQALVDATMRYVHGFAHVLAGFQGPGIPVVAEIHDFATENGLGVHTLDLVKHMNADQAACGYGCSGNPYDAYWSFSPIGHGDLHELGHGLERGRLRFDGWPGHASTNPYSYYSKSHYFLDTGREPDCPSLPFEPIHAILSDARRQPDPIAYVQANLWARNGWSDGAVMTLQTMMAVQADGALQEGWHLLARLHVIEREYQIALRDEADWLARRTGLGMPSYGRDEARALSSNDWLLLALSHASGRDVRDWLDVWGQPYSDTAAGQVAALALPMLPTDYFVTSANGYCRGEGFDGLSVALDGKTVWPLP